MKIPTVRLLAAGLVGALAVVLLGAYALMASYVYLLPSLPTVDAMRSGALAAPLRVYTRSGELIGEIGTKRRLPVAYADIPVLVREAFVAAEDEHFFEHHGFDYAGVLRAAWVDLMSGDFSQGASTITMQAARNMFLNFDKTIRRKLQEIFLTYRMEHEFSKDEILDTYLNVIFLGQRSYGVAAAAQTYFGKPLDQLTVAEAATLAGIPQAPSRYNPIYNPRATKARRRYVLGQMLKLGDIDAATAKLAADAPVQARDHGILYDVEAPYMAEMARADLVSRYGADAVNDGYRVYTTIDGRLQTAANRAVRLGLIEYSRRHGYRGPLHHAAIGPHASTKLLDATLVNVPAVGDLWPAVVVAVANRTARVYLGSMRYAQIDWDGLSWARRRLPDMSVGPAPQRAADVVQVGDVVYVVANDKGVAQLAQLPEVQGALAALDPDDGAVAALVGGFDYYANKFNRVTQARRQPGSGFKPFWYSCALDRGFTPATIVLDAPIVYDDSTGQEKIWRPENDEKTFGGPMRLREGLVHSLNLMTIRVVRQLGIDTATQCAANFGFNPDDMPKDLTIALGSLPVTPLQMVSGYAVFANGGYRVSPYFIDRIVDASGKVVYQAAPKVVCERCDTAGANAGTAAPGTAAATPASATTGVAMPAVTPTAAAIAAAGAAAAVPIGLASAANPSAAQAAAPAAADPDLAPASLAPPLLPANRIAPRVISPQNAWLMDDMMADVIRRGTGQRALVLKRNDIAGKTGTSNDQRDAWFNGFNRNIVASVWVGFDDEQPLGESEQGSLAAVPIWVSFMREALRGQPDVARPLPPGLVTERISKSTGLLAGPNDPDAMYETFMADHLPPAANAGVTVPGTTQTPDGGGTPLF